MDRSATRWRSLRSHPTVGADHADSLYRAIVKRNGKRAGTYCMLVCRRVWNEAIRGKKLKGPNPFARTGSR